MIVPIARSRRLGPRCERVPLERDPFESGHVERRVACAGRRRHAAPGVGRDRRSRSRGRRPLVGRSWRERVPREEASKILRARRTGMTVLLERALEGFDSRRLDLARAQPVALIFRVRVGLCARLITLGKRRHQRAYPLKSHCRIVLLERDGLDRAGREVKDRRLAVRDCAVEARGEGRSTSGESALTEACLLREETRTWTNVGRMDNDEEIGGLASGAGTRLDVSEGWSIDRRAHLAGGRRSLKLRSDAPDQSRTRPSKPLTSSSSTPSSATWPPALSSSLTTAPSRPHRTRREPEVGCEAGPMTRPALVARRKRCRWTRCGTAGTWSEGGSEPLKDEEDGSMSGQVERVEGRRARRCEQGIVSSPARLGGAAAVLRRRQWPRKGRALASFRTPISKLRDSLPFSRHHEHPGHLVRRPLGSVLLPLGAR